jgi:hypothetical protein
MVKTLLFAVALLLLGALAGNEVAHYAAARHQPARAVMLLAQFHFDRLAAAVKSGQCGAVLQERERLLGICNEIPAAFPKTYGEDAEFRKRADSLREAVRWEPALVGDCNSAAAKKIDDACVACHRDYR